MTPVSGAATLPRCTIHLCALSMTSGAAESADGRSGDEQRRPHAPEHGSVFTSERPAV